jgi:hypothetical protein
VKCALTAERTDCTNPGQMAVYRSLGLAVVGKRMYCAKRIDLSRGETMRALQTMVKQHSDGFHLAGANGAIYSSNGGTPVLFTMIFWQH